MKVWHVNHIAFVGPTLVGELNKINWNAETFDTPKPMAGSSIWLKLFGAPYRCIYARRLVRKARANKVDILHVHYLSTALWYLGSGIPLVVHAHGADVRLSRWQVFRHLVNYLVCKNADCVLYATPDLKEHLKRHTDASIFLPNPIDTELFKVQAVKTNPRLVMIHFALNYLKGALTMLEAVRRLTSRCPGIEFQAIGFGEYVDEAREAGVRLLPKARREDLPQIVSEAGLVFGQLHVGAVGMSELETLALGKTVACNFQYYNAYPEPPPFIQVATVDEIVRVIEAFYKDSQVYAGLEGQARSWVEKYHRADKVAGQLVEIYSSILPRDKQKLTPPHTPRSPEYSSLPHK